LGKLESKMSPEEVTEFRRIMNEILTHELKLR
jgi:hypothetical protein